MSDNKTKIPGSFSVPQKPIIKTNKKVDNNYAVNLSDIKFFIVLDVKKIEEYQSKKIEAQVEAAAKKVEEQKTKRKRRNSLIFFLINIAIIAILLVWQANEGNVDPPGKLVINWWFLTAAIGMFVLGMIIEQLRFMILTKKAVGMIRPRLSYKAAAIGRYYDLITPFAVGGQPFQIFYLRKYAVSGGNAISIVMSKYIFSQIAYFMIISVFLFGNIGTTILGVDGALMGVIYTSSWIGYAIVAVLIISVGLVSLNKRIGVGLVVGCTKLYCKMFRRDPSRAVYKSMRTVTTWQTTMRKYNKSPFIWIFSLLLSALYCFAIWMIPYFIYCAFEGWDPTKIIDIVTLVIMTELASSIMPLPGGSGMAELSFNTLFFALFTTGTTFWAMLIWKLITYYAYLAQGLVVICYDFFVGNKRLEKNRERWANPKLRFKRKDI